MPFTIVNPNTAKRLGVTAAAQNVQVLAVGKLYRIDTSVGVYYNISGVAATVGDLSAFLGPGSNAIVAGNGQQLSVIGLVVGDLTVAEVTTVNR